jgi:hypothetical protein
VWLHVSNLLKCWIVIKLNNVLLYCVNHLSVLCTITCQEGIERLTVWCTRVVLLLPVTIFGRDSLFISWCVSRYAVQVNKNKKTFFFNSRILCYILVHMYSLFIVKDKTLIKSFWAIQFHSVCVCVCVYIVCVCVGQIHSRLKISGHCKFVCVGTHTHTHTHTHTCANTGYAFIETT